MTERGAALEFRGIRLVLVALGLGIGSPLLFLLLRIVAALAHGAPLGRASLAHELSVQLATVGYIATSTLLVVLICGAIARRVIDRVVLTSLTDPLTQAANRRALEARMSTEIARAAAARIPVTLMVVDVDQLKEVNDVEGHLAGDRALCTVADVLGRACRSRDMVARWGGDEFVVLMARTGAPEAMAVAERVHKALRALSADGRSLPLSVSVGIAEYDGTQPTRPIALFEAADRALFNAKRKGRNRTSIAPAGPPGRRADDEVSGIRASATNASPATPLAARVK